MVPGIVPEVVAQCELAAVGAVLQRFALEADEELVTCAFVVGLARAVGYQCAVLIGCLKPEHQRVVLLVVALEEVGAQLQALVLTGLACLGGVDSERHALGLCPRGTAEHQVGTLRLVGGIVARAVVHRVVVGQSHLVARQQAATVAVQCGQVHRAVPQAALQHAALEELLLAVGSIFGSTEGQMSRATVGDIVPAAYLHVVIE